MRIEYRVIDDAGQPADLSDITPENSVNVPLVMVKVEVTPFTVIYTLKRNDG